MIHVLLGVPDAVQSIQIARNTLVNFSLSSFGTEARCPPPKGMYTTLDEDRGSGSGGQAPAQQPGRARWPKP